MPTTKCEHNANEHTVTIDLQFLRHRFATIDIHIYISAELHFVELADVIFRITMFNFLIHYVKDAFNVFPYVQRWDLMLDVDFEIYSFHLLCVTRSTVTTHMYEYSHDAAPSEAHSSTPTTRQK